MTATASPSPAESAHTDSMVEILDSRDPADLARLDALRDSGSVRLHDTLEAQQTSLAEVIPRPDDAILDEAPRWVHYPWRSSIVRVLGPVGFRRLRLDRNRNKITAQEQDRLHDVTVGVIGLSVGHAVAHTLAIEGLAGTIRLADFDTMDLANLNRVPGSVFDLGVNKAVVAARRIAELDPYLRIEIMPGVIDENTVVNFLAGLDIVLEECDSFDAKVIIRDHARAEGIPVIMETSDGGVLDVERFDLDRERPLFHGLLGTIDAAALSGLTTAQKVPLGIALLDASRVTARMAASALELGRTISTWPQLGGDVALGGATCAAAVRRLALGHHLPSGRIRVDVDALLGDITDPLAGADRPVALTGALDDIATTFAALPDRDAVVYAGTRAPSAGNSQPWVIARDAEGLTITPDPYDLRRVDIDRRASAVALGAVAHNMRVAAAARTVFGELTMTGSGPDLEVRFTFGTAGHPDTAAQLAPMLQRASNRLSGDRSPLSERESRVLTESGTESGTDVRIIGDTDRIDRCAAILAAQERIRYLTPDLHSEMIDEIRWAGSDGDPATGLTLDSLGGGPNGPGMLEIARRADVMAHLDEWDMGSALAAPTQAIVGSSSALIGICQTGWTSADFVRGGMAGEAVWIAATAMGLAVCPVAPISLYARDDEDRAMLSSKRADELSRLDAELRELFGINGRESIAMVLRVFRSAATSPISRRRAF